MGIDWWEHDPSLSVQERDLVSENRALRTRIGELEEARQQDAQQEDGRERAPQRAEKES